MTVLGERGKEGNLPFYVEIRRHYPSSEGYVDVFAKDSDEAYALAEAEGYEPFKVVKYG